METKTVHPKTYFFNEGKTSLNKIRIYSQTAVPALMQEMEKMGLEANGPVEFIYYGASADPDQEFTLRVAVPVKNKKSPSDRFQYTTTETFKCRSSEYRGDVNQMPAAYGKIYEQIYREGYQPNGEIREIYHQWEHPSSEKNITEIQIGVN